MARLRMEVASPTRIVRRQVELSVAMTLKMVALTIRGAWGLWETDREWRFVIGGATYASTKRKVASADHRGGAGKRIFGKVLGDCREFEFVHNIGRDRRVKVEVAALGECGEPETAFPRLTEAAGVIAVSELTPDDSDHHLVIVSDDTGSYGQADAIAQIHDDELRAAEDHRRRHWAVDTVRRKRRGPLRSHQTASRRNKGVGLAPEPETEPEPLYDQGPRHKAAVFSPRPVQATVERGTAVFADDDAVDDMRALSDKWALDEDGSPRSEPEAIRRSEDLARHPLADLHVIANHARVLEAQYEWKAAIAVYAQAVGLASDALPVNFRGPVDKDTWTGRAVVAAVEGLGRTECAHGSNVRGIAAYEIALGWNQLPCAEAKLRIGSEYAKTARFKDARTAIAAYGDTHAMHLYDLVLCEIGDGTRTSAVTAARRALAFGPYMGELLRGNNRPMPVPMGSLKAGRSLGDAKFYHRHYWWGWQQDKSGSALLQWVATHPLAIGECARLRAIDHCAAHEADPQRREELNKRFDKAVRKLDDELSEEMIATWDEGGHAPPWAWIEKSAGEDSDGYGY